MHQLLSKYIKRYHGKSKVIRLIYRNFDFSGVSLLTIFCSIFTLLTIPLNA